MYSFVYYYSELANRVNEKTKLNYKERQNERSHEFNERTSERPTSGSPAITV